MSKKNNVQSAIEGKNSDDIVAGSLFSNPYTYAVGAYGEIYVFCRDAEQAYHFAQQLRDQGFVGVFIDNGSGKDVSDFCREMYTKRYGDDSSGQKFDLSRLV